MKALLQPGDKVTIRSDIREDVDYKMKTNNSSNVYVVNLMASPGETVTIKGYRHDQYYVNEDDFWNYTDEMFDPDLIEYLQEDYKNKN